MAMAEPARWVEFASLAKTETDPQQAAILYEMAARAAEGAGQVQRAAEYRALSGSAKGTPVGGDGSEEPSVDVDDDGGLIIGSSEPADEDAEDEEEFDEEEATEFVDTTAVPPEHLDAEEKGPVYRETEPAAADAPPPIDAPTTAKLATPERRKLAAALRERLPERPAAFNRFNATLLLLALPLAYIVYALGLGALRGLWALVLAGDYPSAFAASLIFAAIFAVVYVGAHVIGRRGPSLRKAGVAAQGFGFFLLLAGVVMTCGYAVINTQFLASKATKPDQAAAAAPPAQAVAPVTDPVQAEAPASSTTAATTPAVAPPLVPTQAAPGSATPAAPPISAEPEFTPAIPTGATVAAPSLEPAPPIGPVSPAATTTFPAGLADEWRNVAPLTVKAVAVDSDAGALAFASFVGNDLKRVGPVSYDELVKVRELAATIFASYTTEEICKEQTRLLQPYAISASPDGELVGVSAKWSLGVQKVLEQSKRRPATP